MKSTGIVRRVDDLGRVVIPKELRRTLGIAEGDPLEIFVDEDRIILRKYFPNNGCSICESTSDNYAEIGQHRICTDCAKKILNTLYKEESEKIYAYHNYY